MKNNILNNKFKISLCFAAFTSTFLMSSNSAHAESNSSHSSFNKAWQLANLYKNEQGDYLKLSGRLQLDSTWANAEQGDYNDTLWRRFRFGFKGKIGELTGALEADINLNKSLSESYNRLTDAKISWAVNKQTKVTFLKHSAGFTLDGKTSSKKLLTPQRNNLTNNLWFTSEYFTGVSVRGKLDNNWSYNSGIFSSDGSDEIGFSDASYFALLSSSKKLEKNSFWDNANLSFDYIYNDTHKDGNTRNFSQVASFSSKFNKGNWGLHNDLSFGQGDLGQSNIFGFVIMPIYQQNEMLQWVTRYTYIYSSDENGVRLGRYENRVTSERGDNYQEIYGGVNYLLHGQKLKLQAGLQYVKMADEANDGGEYDGWGLTLAIRTYW